MNESIASRIEEKFSDVIYAVYFNYSGDHNDPYHYFIGCQVPEATSPAPGLSILNVAGAYYTKITAKGKMPDCETVGWERGNSFTISPHIQELTLSRCSTMAMRAGCPSALSIVAVAFWLSVKNSVFVVPIVIFLYCNNTI